MLQAVEERERNAVRHREDLDPLQRVGERRRLDCDHQQRDRLLQVLHGLRSRLHDACGALELDPARANCFRGGGSSNADDAMPRGREPRGEHAAHAADPEYGDGRAHALAGSVTRLTYRTSE